MSFDKEFELDTPSSSDQEDVEDLEDTARRYQIQKLRNTYVGQRSVRRDGNIRVIRVYHANNKCKACQDKKKIKEHEENQAALLPKYMKPKFRSFVEAKKLTSELSAGVMKLIFLRIIHNLEKRPRHRRFKATFSKIIHDAMEGAGEDIRNLCNEAFREPMNDEFD